MKTYPLLLKPPVKDYIWGGTRLKDEFGYETDKDIAAEAWVLSCHKDGWPERRCPRCSKSGAMKPSAKKLPRFRISLF